MFKKLILPLLMIWSASVVCAQEAGNDDCGPIADDKVYEMFDVQKAPSFPGSEKALMKFIGQNLQYPVDARNKGIAGTVVLKFVVRKDGTVTDIRVDKSVGGGCNEEALRVVRRMPQWIPGELNGTPVHVLFTLPIRFRLV